MREGFSMGIPLNGIKKTVKSQYAVISDDIRNFLPEVQLILH